MMELSNSSHGPKRSGVSLLELNELLICTYNWYNPLTWILAIGFVLYSFIMTGFIGARGTVKEIISTSTNDPLRIEVSKTRYYV